MPIVSYYGTRLKTHHLHADNDSRQKLNTAIALVEFGECDETHWEYLWNWLLRTPVVRFDSGHLEGDTSEMGDYHCLIREVLSRSRLDLAERLWHVLEQPEQDAERIIAAASALAELDTQDDARWRQVSDSVATSIFEVAEKLPFESALGEQWWVRSLRPVRHILAPAIVRRIGSLKEDTPSRAGYREWRFLETYAPDVPAVASQMILDMDRGYGWLETLDGLPDKQDFAQELLRLLEIHELNLRGDDPKRINIAFMFARYGKLARLLDLLEYCDDASLRTMTITCLSYGLVFSGEYEWLSTAKVAEILEKEPHRIGVVQGFILALGGLRHTDNEIWPLLVRMHHEHPDSGVHSAIDQIMLSRRELAQNEPITLDRRMWFVTPEKHTMIVLPNRVAVSSTEVTERQYRRFAVESSRVSETADGPKDVPSNNVPQAMVTWYDAAEYCNWVSKKEGIPEEQWCYIPNRDGQFANGMRIANDFKEREGYRLPTQLEWEHACRASTVTKRFPMHEIHLLHPRSQYGRYAFNFLDSLSEYIAFGQKGIDVHPETISMRHPNQLGLFDTLGNVAEWCHDVEVDAHDPRKIPSEDTLTVGDGGIPDRQRWVC